MWRERRENACTSQTCSASFWFGRTERKWWRELEILFDHRSDFSKTILLRLLVCCSNGTCIRNAFGIKDVFVIYIEVEARTEPINPQFRHRRKHFLPSSLCVRI